MLLVLLDKQPPRQTAPPSSGHLRMSNRCRSGGWFGRMGTVSWPEYACDKRTYDTSGCPKREASRVPVARHDGT